MSILSIDVGMKHLAVCVINNNTENHSIIAWDVINLCSMQNAKNCSHKLKSNKICNKKAKYTDGNNHYCKLHAKQIPMPMPPQDLTPNKINKMKLCDLKKLSLTKLKSLLDKLVNLEDYEKAVKIRDEISKRESKK